MNFRFNDKEKDDFYETELCRSDFNITVIGEMNANVGHVHSGSTNVMGKPA